MSRLTMRLLGSPQVDVDGAPVEVDTRKATALLASLAVAGRPQSRDSLAALLWPEYDQVRAHAALRRTLSTLKKGLRGGWVNPSRGSIALDPEGVWVDVLEFRRLRAEARDHRHPDGAACAGCARRLSEAAELYRDDFLAGFALRDSPAFDDWQFFHAESLRRELGEVLDLLVEMAARQGDVRQAIAHARRRLELDPLHEPAHRRLMELHVVAGDRSSALRQYRDCLMILERELGVEPLEDTTALYHDLKEGTAALRVAARPAREAPSPTGPGIGPLPLVGRDAQWEVLQESYRRIDAGGRLLVVEGEPGIGKTRLIEELAADLRTRGAAVIAGRCYEDESGLAFGAVIGLLRAAVSLDDGAWLRGLPRRTVTEVGRLLPAVHDVRPEVAPAGPLDTPAAQSLFFDAVAEAFAAALSGPTPGMLVVDDLHWIDDSSLALIAYLIRRLDRVRLCLLLAWRSAELGMDHGLNRLVADARRAGRATHVILGRLTRAEVDRLVSALDLDHARGKHLYDESEGLPFFVNEYVSVMARHDDREDMPVGVRDLLRSRVAGLTRGASQILGAAAVIGRACDVDLLRATSGRSDEEIVAGVEELGGRGVLREIAETDPTQPRYEFAHPKLRTLVYDELGLARRRLLHRRVADGLVRARRGERDGGDAAAIAQHLYRAGDHARAAEWFKEAGAHDRRLFANAEALEHLQAALALGHPATAELHEALGDVQVLFGDYAAALTSYERAAAHREDADTGRIDHRLGLLHQRMGEWELAEAHLDAALVAVDETDTALRARLHADRGLARLQRGATRPAEEDARTALELAEQTRAPDALAQAHNILGMSATKKGDAHAARDHLEKSLVLAEEVADPSARVAAMNNLALAYRAEGRLDDAVELTESALELCSEQGDRHREAALHNNLADLLHARGDVEAALAQVTRSAAIFADVGQGGTMEPAIWRLVEW
ncbi:MAG: tetratricopeptide repeat protein [Actinomycetota bacterium]